jgi:predicted O-linked N-acetylglucosamine transferase (SPINDLY family)
LLHAIGHSEWAARDGDEYVRIAVALAAEPARLANIRRGLRAQMQNSSLLDHAGQAKRFGAALRSCWADWCSRTAGKAA